MPDHPVGHHRLATRLAGQARCGGHRDRQRQRPGEPRIDDRVHFEFRLAWPPYSELDDRLTAVVHDTPDHRPRLIRYAAGCPTQPSQTSAADLRARSRVTAA